MEVWFAPTMVMEVVGAELSLSPIHPAAMGAIKEAHGFSLRFPRFIKIRDDKKPEEATNLDELVSMFKAQGHKAVVADDAE